MAIFPNSPSPDQIVWNDGAAYRWDGVKWVNGSPGTGPGDGDGGGITLVPPGIGNTIAATQLAVSGFPAPGQNNTNMADVGLNAYYGVDGVWRYINNGGAGFVQALSWAQGQSVSRVQLGIAGIGSGGAGAVGDGAFNVVGDATNHYAVVGDGNALIFPMPMRDSLAAAQLLTSPVDLGYQPGDFTSRMGFNVYTDGAGTHRYVGNGAGAQLGSHNISSSVVGLQNLARFSIVLAGINTQGPGAICNQGGVPGSPNQLGGGLHLVSNSAPGQDVGTFVTVGAQINVPWPLPTIGSLFANFLCIEPQSIPTAPEPRARIGLNFYLDPAGSWHYIDNGPAAFFATQSFTQAGVDYPRLNIGVADINTAGPGADGSNPPKFHGAIGIEIGPNGPYVTLGDATHIPPFPPLGASLVADQLLCHAQPGPSPTDLIATLGLNIYVDSSGAVRYLDNGAGAAIVTHGELGGLGRLAIAVGTPNTAGSGAIAGTYQGVLQLVAATDAWNNVSPYVQIGDGAAVWPTGPWPTRWSLLVGGSVTVAADPLDLGGGSFSPDRVARIGLNAMENQGPAGGWTFLRDGPVAALTTHDANQGPLPLPAANLQFAIGDAGTAGSGITFGRAMALSSASGIGSNETSMYLLVNRGGTFSTAKVKLGAASSGGAGLRALVVDDN